MTYFLGPSALSFKIEKYTCVIMMDEKQLKIVLSVLDAVRSTFPETNESIDSTLKEECEKDNCRWGNYFLQV